MIQLHKLRLKDVVRLLIAAACIAIAAAAAFYLLGSLPIAAVVGVVVGAFILTRRSYRYFWQVVLGRRRKGADWSNYFRE